MDSTMIVKLVIELTAGLLVNFVIFALIAVVLAKVLKRDVAKYVRTALILALVVSSIGAAVNVQKNFLRAGAGGPQSVSGANSIQSGSIEARSVVYWSSARPIVDRQISEFGRPYATLFTESRPGLLRVDRATWEWFISESKRLTPGLKRAIDELSRLGVPSGRTYEWHEKQLLAWSRRSEAIDMVVAGWDGGDSDLLEEGFQKFEESQKLGLEADRMQADLISWLQGQPTR